MLITSGVAVVLRIRAIANDKQLDVFKQAAVSPETLTLVTIDLVERLTQLHTTALEFNVH